MWPRTRCNAPGMGFFLKQIPVIERMIPVNQVMQQHGCRGIHASRDEGMVHQPSALLTIPCPCRHDHSGFQGSQSDQDMLTMVCLQTDSMSMGNAFRRMPQCNVSSCMHASRTVLW